MQIRLGMPRWINRCNDNVFRRRFGISIIQNEFQLGLEKIAIPNPVLIVVRRKKLMRVQLGLKTSRTLYNYKIERVRLVNKQNI
jgi:hypothetical protein